MGGNPGDDQTGTLRFGLADDTLENLENRF